MSIHRRVVCVACNKGFPGSKCVMMSNGEISCYRCWRIIKRDVKRKGKQLEDAIRARRVHILKSGHGRKADIYSKNKVLPGCFEMGKKR